jgi:hypothetical protein
MTAFFGTPLGGLSAASASPLVRHRRIAQLFVCDADPRVPLELCMVYSGLAKITEATDEELVGEINLDSLLQTYNVKRIKVPDYTITDHASYLGEIKREELKIVVHTLAAF